MWEEIEKLALQEIIEKKPDMPIGHFYETVKAIKLALQMQGLIVWKPQPCNRCHAMGVDLTQG